MTNRYSKTVQRIATTTPNGRMVVRFDHKTGVWVKNIKTDEGWDNQTFASKVVLIPNSVQVGYIGFMISKDEKTTKVVRKFTSGDTTPVEREDLPEIRYRVFDTGEIVEDREGWRPAVLVDGYTMARGDNNELKRVDIRIEANTTTSCYAIGSLFDRITTENTDDFPKLSLTSDEVTGSNGMTYVVPVLDIIGWINPSEPDAPASPAPTPVPVEPPVADTEEEEFERLMNG